MSRNDVILGLVALALVAFSLVVSLVVPRRNPDFPGRRLRLFVLVSALFVLAMLAAVEVLGEAHEGAAHKAQEEKADTGGVDTGAVTTGQTGTQADTGETGGDELGEAGDPEAGADVFASAGCGSCHTLQAAGSTGTVGPDLDESQPSFELAVDRVTNGASPMPAFKDQLSEQQINDVAAYVVESTKG